MQTTPIDAPGLVQTDVRPDMKQVVLSGPRDAALYAALCGALDSMEFVEFRPLGVRGIVAGVKSEGDRMTVKLRTIWSDERAN